MINCYAGIGSRTTPNDILVQMYNIAVLLAKKGYILRSGGADGADSAFEKGCDSVNGKKEIYLPWKGFNNNKSELYKPTQEAFETARANHPRWFYLKDGAQKLHARNSHQILGLDLKSPVKFVICWTQESGGTEQALRLARNNEIQIINLYHVSDYSVVIEKLIGENKCLEFIN